MEPAAVALSATANPAANPSGDSTVIQTIIDKSECRTGGLASSNLPGAEAGRVLDTTQRAKGAVAAARSRRQTH